MSNEFFYPFDPTGTASTNLVVGERQTVNPPAAMDFYYIVPKAGPYFRNSLQITLFPSGAPLQEGIDYNCTHEFMAATKETGQGVYGSITFYDHTLTGIVSLQYQTIGGDWVIDEQTILEILANVQIDPRITTWEQAVDVPYQFPPIDHEFNIDDFVGADDVVTQLAAIKQAIIDSGDGLINTHVADFNNPHHTTKAHVGLGNVDNFFIATAGEAQAGLINTAFMTPLRVAQAIQTLAWTRIDNHAIRQDNPHGVTKSQVGLGNVDNLSLASQVEAETGASHARFMTPLRTAQAITLQAVTPLNTFIARRDNPHVVTKAQIGLSVVDNFATASQADAEAGTAADKFMTANRVREAVKYQVGDFFTAHLANEANPHNVTKAQIGLANVQNFPIADQVTAEAGASNSHYMTPLATRYAIQTLADASVGAHAGLTNNPHATTKAQVGLGSVDNYATANQADAELGTAADKFMTPVGTKQAIDLQALAPLNAFIARRDNPHVVTAAQVGLGSVNDYAMADQSEAEAGTSNVKYMSPLRTAQAINVQAVVPLNTFIARRDNPHVVTAAQVGAYTTAQVDNLLTGKLGSTATATNSNLVYGLTKIQLFAEIDDLTVANSLLLNGKTEVEIKNEALQGTAANSLLLGGQTKTDILNEFIGSGLLGADQNTIAPIVAVFNPADPLNEVPMLSSWTKLGTVLATTPNGTTPSSVTFVISGGADNGPYRAAPSIIANMVFNVSTWADTGTPDVEIAELQWLNGSAPGYDLFYRIVSNTLEIWAQNGQYRDEMTITELSERTLNILEAPVITDSTQMITVAPAGVVAFVDKGAPASSVKLTELEAAIVAGTASLNAL